MSDTETPDTELIEVGNSSLLVRKGESPADAARRMAEAGGFDRFVSLERRVAALLHARAA